LKKSSKESKRTKKPSSKKEKLAKNGKKPKFIYVVPDFQNPSGVTMTLERRETLLKLAYKYEVPIVEDSPYRDLRFAGQTVPAIYGLDTENQVIVLGTFSKLLCPGLRLAWIIAPTEWMDKMVVAKQGMDLCSPSYTQLIVAEFLKRGPSTPTRTIVSQSFLARSTGSFR
jgi:DNA-binding transcriptional MocR family regulator